MSTVVLTPTHIASDHSYVQSTIPVELKTDINHKKLFLDKSRLMVVAHVGNFDPNRIDNDDVFDILKMALIDILHQQTAIGLIKGIAVIPRNKDMKRLETIFDPTPASPVILVTRHHRFCLYKPALDENHWYAKRLGDYYGAGTGGAIAVGLLTGGRTIHDLWKPLHELDTVSSVEHTAIPLKSLKVFPKKFYETLAGKNKAVEEITADVL